MKLDSAKFAQNYVALVRDRLKDVDTQAVEFDEPVDLMSWQAQGMATEGWIPLETGSSEDFQHPRKRSLLMMNATTALRAAGNAGPLAAAIAVEAAKQMITPGFQEAMIAETHQEYLNERPLVEDPDLNRDAQNWFNEIKAAAGNKDAVLYVTEGDSDNAACLGNRIYANAGLIEAGRETTIAALGHEMGHSEAKDFAIPLALEAVSEVLPGFPMGQFQAINHECEHKADERQVELMVALGEDTAPALSNILDTEMGWEHPAGPDRVERMVGRLRKLGAEVPEEFTVS